jgi:hypothetical protein
VGFGNSASVEKTSAENTCPRVPREIFPQGAHRFESREQQATSEESAVFGIGTQKAWATLKKQRRGFSYTHLDVEVQFFEIIFKS